MSGCSRSTTSSAASPVAGPEDSTSRHCSVEAEAHGLDDVGLVVDDEDPHHGSSAGPAGRARRA